MTHRGHPVMVRSLGAELARAAASDRDELARGSAANAQLPPGWDGGKGQEAGPPGMGPPPGLVHQPGGDAMMRLLSPGFKVFEEMYQSLPEESWYDPTVSPTSPVQWELGAFQVPNGTHLWVCDYTFTPCRLSGVDAGDIIPIEDGRLGTILGFDITISSRRPSHLLYQLDPVPVSTSRQAFQAQPTASSLRPTTAAGTFNRARAQSFGASASPGTALLPSRRARQGAESMPFTMVAREGDRVALSVVIFRPVPLPLGSIMGRHAGFLVASNMSEAILNRMRPR